MFPHRVDLGDVGARGEQQPVGGDQIIEGELSRWERKQRRRPARDEVHHGDPWSGGCGQLEGTPGSGDAPRVWLGVTTHDHRHRGLLLEGGDRHAPCDVRHGGETPCHGDGSLAGGDDDGRTGDEWVSF